MRSFVITIRDMPKSLDAAARCIESGKRYGVEIDHLWAITPDDSPIEKALELEIPVTYFREKYSRFENVIAAFLSHYSAWQWSILNNEEIQVFEHDAVIMTELPDQYLQYQGCINLGAPSYGKYSDPQTFGVNPLTSKRYFPGAHAYRLKPSAAKILVEKARTDARPTDVFLNTTYFPFLEEYYPWPAVAKDSFTTIQNKTGCLAKHNYSESYGIL